MAKPHTNRKRNWIKHFYAAFSAESIINALQTTICHPSNQKFTHYLAYLIAEVLNTPETQFGNKTFQAQDLKTLISQTASAREKITSITENFTGFDQTKSIPIFWSAKMFHFFYGLYDRPYEYWRELTDIFTAESLSSVPAYLQIKIIITESLEWQTDLIEKINSLEESFHHSGEIYVPSQDWAEALIPFFNRENPSETAMSLGELPKIDRRKLINQADKIGNFIPTLFIKIGGKTLFLYPQLHLRVLLQMSRELILKTEKHRAAFRENFMDRLFTWSKKLLKYETPVYHLLAESHREDFLADLPGPAYQFDTNKLVIFTPVQFSGFQSAKTEIQALTENIGMLLKRIGMEDAIGLHRNRNERMIALVTEHIEFYIILVYEKLDLNESITLKKSKGWDNIWLFSMIDLKAIAEHLQSPIDFIKFLQEDKHLHFLSKPKNEFIDRFRWFLFNKNVYINNAATPESMYFPSHQWSEWHSEEMYKKFANDLDIYKYNESNFPGFFSKIEKYNDKVFILSDPPYSEALYVADLSGEFIAIYLPDNPRQLSYRDATVGMDLFGPMFGDYISQLDTDLIDLLTEQSIEKYSVLIAPTGFVHRDKVHFPFLQDAASIVNESNPYTFVTLPIGYREVRTYFIFDASNTDKIFNTENNEGERLVIEDFLLSVGLVRNQESPQFSNRASRLVDKILPIGKKGYGMDALEIDNPDINFYPSPIEPTLTDHGMAKRTLATFLRKNKFRIGDHENDEAKGTLKNIYDFLQYLIEAKIAQYDEGFIVFAYQQLELNEGKIEINKLKSGLRGSRRLNYDLNDSVQEIFIKESTLASTIRHLLHSAIKISPKGSRSPTATDWSYLLGVCGKLLEIATSFDYQQHHIRSTSVGIDKTYSIQIHDRDRLLDLSKYTSKDSAQRLRYAVHAFEQSQQENPSIVNPETDPTKDAHLRNEEALNNAFTQAYNVSFSNIALILYVLSKMELPPTSDFPVYVIQKKELVKIIQSHITIDLEDSQIDQTLIFLSLKPSIFPDDKFLYFGAMLRNRHRITLCPFVELADGSILFGRECIDGTIKLWNDVWKGHLPFGDDQNSQLNTVLRQIRDQKAKRLENLAEGIAKNSVGAKYVEARINKFNRLSPTLKVKEPCGEIDLLCINPATKTAFVFDCKSAIKIPGIYQIKRNIEEFFAGKKSYQNKLNLKTAFIQQNLPVILQHFEINDTAGWAIYSGFIVKNVQYAEFYSTQKVNFIALEELSSILTQPHLQP